jgi:hypothetical protein
VAGPELDAVGVPSAAARVQRARPGDGTIPESAVIGRVFLVIWLPAQLKEVPIPATFAQHQLDAVAGPRVPLAEHRHLPLAAYGHIPAAVRAHLPLARR